MPASQTIEALGKLLEQLLTGQSPTGASLIGKVLGGQEFGCSSHIAGSAWAKTLTLKIRLITRKRQIIVFEFLLTSL